MLSIFSAAWGFASEDSGSAEGPNTIEHSAYCSEINDYLDWQPAIAPEKAAASLRKLAVIPELASISAQLATQIKTAIENGRRTITIGGDHSCGIGTWSGVASALQSEGELGLIWIDAHMDAHTPETSGSKNLHGMPVATLLGYGDDRLTNLLYSEPKTHPENIALIGIRSYQPEEAALLNRLGVKIYEIDEVNQRGFDTVIEEAMNLVTKNTVRFGVSLDVDGLDPEDAPAVATCVPNGIRADELLETLPQIVQNEHCVAFEIAEFNPGLDRSQKTEKLIRQIVAQITQQA